MRDPGVTVEYREPEPAEEARKWVLGSDTEAELKVAFVRGFIGELHNLLERLTWSAWVMGGMPQLYISSEYDDGLEITFDLDQVLDSLVREIGGEEGDREIVIRLLEKHLETARRGL